jgi:hypothetical protein
VEEGRKWVSPIHTEHQCRGAAVLAGPSAEKKAGDGLGQNFTMRPWNPLPPAGAPLHVDLKAVHRNSA